MEGTPEIQAFPGWRNQSGRNADDAVDWFVKLRKVVKSIIYNYCGNLQKALKIFEDNDATHYIALQNVLQYRLNSLNLLILK